MPSRKAIFFGIFLILHNIKSKSFKIKVFKVKFIFRRKASPFIDKSGAKPPIFSQRQSQSQKTGLLRRFAPRNDRHWLRRDKHGASEAKQLVYLGEANPENLLTLTLTENAGFSPAFIYEAEGFV